ncbi:hypothetical protein QBC45DRAFT_448493 [Copromyces sp. CBS 386.78]|nr:hypothetical protein QBC45DRAFT_448493 [Copromyces sp. CBS 386.78]
MVGPERMDSVCRVTVEHQLACDTRPRFSDGTLNRDPSSQPRSCREAAQPARLFCARCHIPKWFKCPYGHSCCWDIVYHVAYGSSGCTCDQAHEAKHSYVENIWCSLTASSEAAHASTSDVSDFRSPLVRYSSSENLEGLTATSATPQTNVASNSFLNAATPGTPDTAYLSQATLESPAMPSIVVTPSTAATPSAEGIPVTESVLRVES